MIKIVLLFVKYCHMLINTILLKVVNWRNRPLRILFAEDLGILSLEVEIKLVTESGSVGHGTHRVELGGCRSGFNQGGTNP